MYLYLVFIDYEPDIKCKSTFIDKRKNIEVAEMVDFKWIEFDEYKKYFSNAMVSVFDKVVPIIKQKMLED